MMKENNDENKNLLLGQEGMYYTPSLSLVLRLCLRAVRG